MLNKRREMIDERREKGVQLGTERKKYIDFALRKYIKIQLDSLKDLPDAIDALPDGQTKRLFDQISDDAVFMLLRTAIEIMRAKDFRQVVGSVDDPDKWETMAFGNKNKPHVDKARDYDIIRSSKFEPFLRDLRELVNMSDDPVMQTVAFQRAQNDTAMQTILKTNPEIVEKYKRAAKRISDTTPGDDLRA
jgi:hypothetical protein